MPNFLDKWPGLGIFLFFCGGLVVYTILISLWAIPGLILMYLVYKSSFLIFNAAPFKANNDSFLEFMLGYNSFVLSLIGIFLVMILGIFIYQLIFKKIRISIKFSDIFSSSLKGIKKIIYFWFGANVFILIPIVAFFVIAGFLSSGGEQSCNMLVCY